MDIVNILKMGINILTWGIILFSICVCSFEIKKSGINTFSSMKLFFLLWISMFIISSSIATWWIIINRTVSPNIKPPSIKHSSRFEFPLYYNLTTKPTNVEKNWTKPDNHCSFMACRGSLQQCCPTKQHILSITSRLK